MHVGNREIAESFALVRPHKHQISLIFGRWSLRPQMVWGRFASGGSPPCANGVLTFDPSAMPGRATLGLSSFFGRHAAESSNDLILGSVRWSSLQVFCWCGVWHGATPLVPEAFGPCSLFAWHVISSICIVP